MQTIVMHLRADSVKATLVDEWNQNVIVLPAMTRGLRVELILKLLDENGQPLPSSALNYASWDFAIANDWDTTTKPQIRVQEGITVTENEIHISLTETNTAELIAALGKNEQAQFGCELAGFTSGITNPEYLLQFDIIIRNRRADAGTGRPEPVGDDSYTAAQIRALFAAKMKVQLSDDGETWYDVEPSEETPENARWYRFRNASVGFDWSDAVPLRAGPRGLRSTLQVDAVTTLEPDEDAYVINRGDEFDAVFDFGIPRGEDGHAATITVGTVEAAPPDSVPEITNVGTATNAKFNFKLPRGLTGSTGHDTYMYVAYAAASDGRNFSLTPSSNLKYRAEIHSEVPIETPSAADFAGATWMKYLGDDSMVYADMLVADSDTSVERVTRLVFENAHIRKGIDGEVIVNFKPAGTTNEEMDCYVIINARTRLSSWTNGGGSPTGGLGTNLISHPDLIEWVTIELYSTFSPSRG